MRASINANAERTAAGGRLLSIQALRAVAALLVVWVHALDAAEYFSVPRQSRFFHWDNFGAVGVDIFFAISGFIVSRVAMRSAAGGAGASRVFLTRRITRIYPLYWILTLSIVAEAELGRHPIDWHAFHWLPTLLLLPGTGYPVRSPLLTLGWSLMFEMYFYLVLTAFLAWTPRRIVRNTMLFLGGMVGMGLAVGIRRPALALWMSPMLLEFLFGCGIGLVYARGCVGKGWGKIAALAGVLGLAATIFTGYGLASEQDWILAGSWAWLRVAVWGVPAALLVGGVLFWSPALGSGPGRVLVFLGDASYSIYLCTIPARSAVEHWWRWFGRCGADWGVLAAAVFCTLVGVGCYLGLERPLMRVFHNWVKPV